VWLWDAYQDVVSWTLSYAGSEWAVVALFLFAMAESSFFPVPPDLLLIAMCLSDAALETPALSYFYAGVCSVASVTGGAVGYAIGLKGGRPLLLRFFKEEKVLRVERAFQRYDVWAVAAAGFTPIPFKIFTISGGAVRLDFPRVLVASIIGRSGRFFLVAAVLAAWGEPVRNTIENNLNWLTLAFFALLFGGFLVARWLGARASRRESP